MMRNLSNSMRRTGNSLQAVSAAHPDRPPIAQAADSKWLDWAPALQRHGIQVEFLCLVDIQRFHDKKFGV